MITFAVDDDLAITTTGGRVWIDSARLGRLWLNRPDIVGPLERLRRPATWTDLTAAERSAMRGLVAAGVVTVSCRDEAGPIATATACSPRARLDLAAEPGGEPVLLSPWAIARRDGSDYIIESVVDGTVIRLFRPQAARTLVDLTEPTVITDRGGLAALLMMFGLAGPRQPADHRHPHEVWTHTLTRTGLAAQPRSAGSVPAPEPAVEPCDIRFTPPDAARLHATDPPLIDVMEQRRSRRDFAATPVTLDQLNELLYRVARTRRRSTEGPYPVSMRPTPSAGGLHELDYYPVVRSCAGLAPGVYRYDPEQHGLTLVTDALPPVVRIVDAAFTALGRTSLPPIVLTLAARFDRTHGKYGDLSYSLTLKNVGVAMQTTYLAAQAMGLAVCALGSGDAAAFADATGLDPLDVSTVGELAIGVPDA